MTKKLITWDIGNTHNRAILWKWHEGQWSHEPPFFNIAKREDEDVIYSNVLRQTIDLPNAIDSGQFFRSNLFFEMPVHYTSTLGIDRLVQAYYLFSNNDQKKTIALIDAGTFTTIDFITPQSLQGGMILPGVGILQESYSRGARLLPPSLNQLKLHHDLPHSSEEAISQGLIHTILGQMRSIFQEFPADHYIFTGGNGALFCQLWSDHASKENCELSELLIHHALTYIYERQQRVTQ